MDLSGLKAIQEKQAQEAKEAQSRNEDALAFNDLQQTIVKSFSTLVDYLDNRVTKTAVVNQLTQVGTPDALKVVEAVNRLDDTIKSQEKTDLTEVTDVLRAVLVEAKAIPKEQVNISIPEQKDYVAQFNELTNAIKAVESVVKAQKLRVEAPIVNVPETQVNVEAPDLTPITKDIERAFKQAIGLIDIPKPEKLDISPLVKEQQKTNKILAEMPIGGGSDGSSSIAPFMVDGALPITGSITASASTLADFSVNDIEEATTSYFGYTKPDGTWMVKSLTDTSVGYATVSNNGAVTSYTDAWTNRATLTFGRFDQAF